jgi:beta-lactamase class A
MRIVVPRRLKTVVTTMNFVRRLSAFSACSAAIMLGTTALAQTPARVDANLPRLEQEISRLATAAGGKMGVAAIHLETGRAVYLNRHEPFPMASSYKVPVAVQLLTRVDRHEIRLDSMITLRPGDLHPGSGTLTELFDDPGVSLSIRNLLELMLLISDNSATDIVLRVAGGPEAVTARMRALGVADVRVDRPTISLISDWIGIRQLPPDSQLSIQTWRAVSRAVAADSQRVAAISFNTDPRDTATPDGMAQLLLKVWRRQALSEPRSALLLDIMTRSTTGASRIKGMLPAATAVAHKTGTIGGTTNDVGIITLPDNAGHVITVAFVKASDQPVETRERTIAHVARAIYDYFLFNP